MLEAKNAIVERKCKCGKYPSFGFPGKKAIACAKCKEYGMVYVKRIKCKCGKYPSFGLSGEKAITCARCKEDDFAQLETKEMRAKIA